MLPLTMSWLTPPGVLGATLLAAIPSRGLVQRLWDPDLWWHLETGEFILDRGAVPTLDPFSFTAPGQPWVAHEWGSEVLLRAIDSTFGLRGIIVWRGMMLFLVYSLVARLFLREAGNRLGTWAVVALGAFAGAASWGERPNLFSFLLFVVTLGLLVRRDRRIWWFVPIAAVWANLHGMVLLGLGLVAVVAAAEGLKLFFKWEGADRSWARRVSLVALAGLLASFINPSGPGLITHGLRLVRAVSPVVTEWASPDFHDPASLLFLATVLLAVAGIGLSPRRADPTDLALLGSFVTLGLFAVRNLPLSAIVAGLIACRYALPAARAMSAERRSRVTGTGASSASAPTSRGLAILNLTVLLVAASFFVIRVERRFPPSGSLADALDPGYPRALAAGLRDPGTRLFSRDAWAGFALYLRWPDLRVAIDGRADFYGLPAVRRYQRIYAGAPEWEDAFRVWCVTHVLIEERSGLAKVISADGDWRLAGSESVISSSGNREQALLFVRGKAPSGCPTSAT